MQIRVRAIIIQEGKLLAIERVLPDRTFWVFPGGEVDNKDTNYETALQRECLEEVGVNVSVEQLVWNRDFKNQLEKFYICTIIGGEVGTGNGPEYNPESNGYIGTHEPKWISLEKLDQSDLKPTELRDLIFNYIRQVGVFEPNKINWQSLPQVSPR